LIENYFVCIGAQKAGTTWLMRVLDKHPDIFVTPVKEIHYFDHLAGVTHHLDAGRKRSRLRKYYARMLTQWSKAGHYRAQGPWYKAYMKPALDDGWYASLFAHRGAARMAGEATPEYAISGEDGFRHLARLAPDARVIYIMRNPVARGWSQVKHYGRRHRLDVANLSIARLVEIVDSEPFNAHGDYVTVLDNLAKVFNPEQVYVGFYEDIHADRLAALAEICGFLGVDFKPDYFPSPSKSVNRSQSANIPDPVRDHLRAKYAPMVAKLEGRLGSLPEFWSKDF
jgi:sulfotransferase family protein